MGFLSSQYRQQIDDEDKKRQQPKTQNPSTSHPKPKDTRSTAQKVGGFLNATGRLFSENTAKGINQLKTGADNLANTATQAITTSDYSKKSKAYQDAVKSGDKNKIDVAKANLGVSAKHSTIAKEIADEGYKEYGKKGGLFNAGTFNTEEEARKGELDTGAKKIGLGAVGSATEVLPFAKGVGLGLKTGKYVATGVAAAKAAETAAKINKGAAVAKLLGSGTAYGAVGSGIDALENDENLTPQDVATGAVVGATSAGIGHIVGVGLGKGFSKAKQFIAALHGKTPESVAASPDFKSSNIADKKTIPVNQFEDPGNPGVVKKNGIPRSTEPSTPIGDSSPVDDVDFRAAFKSNADVAAKLPITSKLGSSKTKDSINFVMSAIVNSKSSGQISTITRKLLPDLSNKDNLELAKKLKDATHENSVKSILNAVSQNSQSSSTAIQPATTISFNSPDTPQSTKFANALVDNGDVASTYIPVKRGNFVEPPLTTNIDTRVTSPQDAQATIALSSVDSPKVSVSAPVNRERASAALVGEPSTSVSVSAEAPTTNVGKGAQNIARRLDEQLASFSDKYKAPDEIIKKLEGSDAVSTPARSHDWLDHYEDTLGVLGRHFGKVGTDLGYKLAEGAKQVSDIQETVRPAIDQAHKLLDKLAKSKSGKSEVQARIYDALENRDNANNILKGKEEKQLYDQVVSVFDYFKQQRVDRGKSVVGEDYSPRTAIRNALDAPDKLLDNARAAFSKDVGSKFSKTRVSEIPDAEINRNIVDLLPTYVSSQAKEFGYEGAMKYAQDNLQNVNAAYLTDGKSYRQGEEYLRNLFQQVLDPRSVSKAERLQNKLIANTYRNQLGFSLKYAAQNLTQRFSTMANVTKEARRVAGKIDKADLDLLRKSSFSADMTNGTEAIQSGENTLGTSTGKIDAFFKRFDPGAKTEKSNVHNSFDLGATQAIVESKPYKDAIKVGMKPAEAAKQALADEAVRDMAIRRGNIVTNDTQFGANFVTKPEFFRNGGTFFGLSDKWYKQYQRFPQGMMQQMTTILKSDDARALDILRRGNPAETNLVDYRKSAEALNNGVEDIIKGIKNGDVHDVSLEVAQGYQKSLNKAMKELNKEMKAVSLHRGTKTAASFGKMWAAASAIQFLFDGGLSLTGQDQADEVRKAAQYGAPLSIPTKDQNPLSGAFIPSSPIGRHGIKLDKAANFIPGVGLAVNRGKEIKRFADALTGDNNQ